jgi:uncharacterized protein (TIGR02117 family)
MRAPAWCGRRAAAVLAALPPAALLAGCAAPPPAAPLAGPVRSWVAVVDRGWHTELCVPAGDATGGLAPLTAGFPGATVLCFGFGERAYLLDGNAGLGAMLAALLPSRAALLLTVLRASPEAAFGPPDVVRLGITSAGAARLVGFIAASLQRSAAGAPERLRPGPYAGSVFYAASGTYDALATCNSWSAAGLRAAGLPVDTAVVFAGQVMDQARRLAAAQARAAGRQSRPAGRSDPDGSASL